MEGADTGNHCERSLRRSSNSHISMSDTESMTSQVDSWHSPLRSESPLRSDDPSFRRESDYHGGNNDKAIVLVDKYYSPVPSPGKSGVPASSPAAGAKAWRRWPHSEKPTSENHDIPTSTPPGGGKEGEKEFAPAQIPATAVVGLNKFVREEPAPAVKKVGPIGGESVDGGLEEGYGGAGVAVGAQRRSRRNVAVRRLALAFRVFEVIACLISFSVMAADKIKGWSGDSFDRYMEYRYCLAVNVIGFVYSGFQALDMAYYLSKGKHIFVHHLRHHFDFAMDQILAYIILSASSSAATRVDDWISNWGADEFTMMASASVAMSFLAFLAFASSSLVSGYNLCNRDSA